MQSLNSNLFKGMTENIINTLNYASLYAKNISGVDSLETKNKITNAKNIALWIIAGFLTRKLISLLTSYYSYNFRIKPKQLESYNNSFDKEKASIYKNAFIDRSINFESKNSIYNVSRLKSEDNEYFHRNEITKNRERKKNKHHNYLSSVKDAKQNPRDNLRPKIFDNPSKNSAEI